ncbi:hypothetical protein [Bradyrhizobium sp. dw_411]|uniref:hypothetical protein n=1 Tax=Bradyrhizobium sp. dw_411 TaxID=2720082 RepID=UPI001BCB6474|nr:hypothetical protein [Bradyrhizobium sp. dw_411]
MYKRNQIEAAISDLIERGTNRPSLALRTRIKRLLDTDRLLGCAPNSDDREARNYAFFDKSPPGTGFEVWFSAYEAFALLQGLQLMWHNWPQRFAVSVLRHVRPELEKEHGRILKMDPATLFDRNVLRQKFVPGSAVFETTKPAFLSIVSHYKMSAEQENAPYACAVHSRLEKATSWIFETTKGVGGGSSMFELTVLAHELTQKLELTKPQKRGRPG